MKDRVLFAITGGIGSGKTTVSRLIEEYGFKVFSCDEIYKEISKTSKYLNELKNTFPFAVDENGELNRKELSKAVFSDPIKLKKLNELSHPMILSELDRRVEKESGLIFCEVPLLFESNLQEKFDYVLIVLRPLSSRLEAIVERDGITKESALKRIENQFNYDNFNDFSSNYLIIENKAGLQELKEQIEKIIKKLTVKRGL